MAPGVQFPFISVSSGLKGGKRGILFSAGVGNYPEKRENSLVGSSVLSLPELLFANVTYSLMEIIKCTVYFLYIYIYFLFFFTHLSFVVVIPLYHEFDFQTKVGRSKINTFPV